MSFQSFHFLALLLLVLLLNWQLRERPAARKNLLLLASAYFYACWDWRLLFLLFGLASFNFLIGRAIANSGAPRHRKALLGLSLAGSLGLLAVFKYHAFFVVSAQLALQALGLNAELPLLKLLMPLGISFYTFQCLSYVLDVYRGQQARCRSLRDFLLFVAFFPTVLAGPITRARQLLPQLASPPPLSGDDLQAGGALFVRGLLKKLLFADLLAAQLVAPAFADPQQLPPWALLLGLYAYTFQIYMDVSGYTDMACGMARMCGFALPKNFNRPYAAATVSNFWQRWHISMSSFFRDYLFFGLGGSRSGNVYRNLMLTFVAIGIWHGAGWNFFVYGVLHGGMVCWERWQRDRRERLGQLEATAGSWVCLSGVLLTFHFVVLTRVLFRAEDLDAALTYLGALGGSWSLPMPWSPMSALALLALLLAAVLHWALPRAGGWLLGALPRLPAAAQGLLLLGLIYLVMVMSRGAAPFVYFQF